MRAIILAAGHSYSMDGIVKCLIKNPTTGKTILQHMIEILADFSISVVVGYKAVSIMQEFPQLDYVYNKDWSITANSYSLGIALDERPCLVLSSDILFDLDTLHALHQYSDAILVKERENRSLSAIHCIANTKGHVVETYVGPLKEKEHAEAIGIYKISSPALLKQWKKNCLQYTNLFIGQNLPFALAESPIFACKQHGSFFAEINTPLDYLHFIQGTCV